MSDGLIYFDEQLAGYQNGEDEPYLFQSSGHRTEFVEIEEELEGLNDYCVASLDAAYSILERRRQDVKEIEDGRKTIMHPEYGDFTQDVIGALEHGDIPKWEQISSFLARVNCLLLLHVFVERSLKRLCVSLSADGVKQRNQKRNESKINAYIGFLRSDCGLTFDESREAESLRESVRKIRNGFAHGDWDRLEAEIRKVSLLNAFKVVSEFFESIEKSVEESASD